jgi:hypothetical protein
VRLLWISDRPDTPSGFGNVTRFLCQDLARRGYSVSILGRQTVQPHDWKGCKVYSTGGTLGSHSLFPFLVRHRPEIVIALGDVWWLPYFSAPHVRCQMELMDTPCCRGAEDQGRVDGINHDPINLAARDVLSLRSKVLPPSVDALMPMPK